MCAEHAVSLASAPVLGWATGVGMDLSEALAHERNGRFKAAADAYARAAESADSDEDRLLALVRRCTCLLEIDLDDAEEATDGLRQLSASLVNEPLLGELELLEGRVAKDRGKHRLALSKLSSAADRLRAPDGSLRLDVSILLAAAERGRGELNQALDRLTAVDEHSLEENLDVKAAWLDELGAVLIARGEFGKAQEILSQALELDERVDSRPYKSGRSRLLLAEAFTGLGRNHRKAAKDHVDEAIEIFEHAGRGLSEAYAVKGRLLEEQGEFRKAISCYREGLEVDRESEDELGEASALCRLAGVMRKSGRLDEAESFLEQARKCLAGIEDDVGIAVLLTEEGELAVERSDYALAAKRFANALQRISEDGDERAIAVAKRKLASARRELGESAEAERLLREARPVLEERGDLKELDELLDDLGEVLLERDRYTEAIDQIEESLRLDDILELPGSKFRSLLLLGRCLSATGRYEEAEKRLVEAYKMCGASEDVVGESDALFHLAEFDAEQGRLDDARVRFRESLSLDGQQSDAVGVARAHRGLAGVFRRQGDLKRAEEHIEDARKSMKRIVDRAESAMLGIEAGRLALDEGQVDIAASELRAAADEFDQISSPVKRGTCLRILAIARVEESGYQEAIQLFGEAETIFREHGALPELDQLYDDLALLYLATNDLPKARKSVEDSLALGLKMNWSRGNGRSQLVLGRIAMRDQNWSEAHQAIDEARRHYREGHDDVGLAAALDLRGDLDSLEEHYDDAIESYKQARFIQQSHRDFRGLARTFRKLGEAYFTLRRFERAAEAFEQAHDQLRAHEDARQRGELELARGKLQVALNNHGSAIEHFKRARDSFKLRSDKDLLAESFRWLATCHQALGEFDDAMTCMREMGLEQARLWNSLLASLNPEISTVVSRRYAEGNYNDAIAAAFQVLEEAIALRTPEIVPENGRPPSTSKRLRAYLTPEARGIAPFGDAQALNSFQNFCVGSFGIFRNAVAHGWRQFDGVDAFAAIAAAHVIASLLDSPGISQSLTGAEDQPIPAES